MDWIARLKTSLASSHEAPIDASKASSVLLCIGQQQGEWEIVLTKRTQLVQTHKGQVSLPGGGREQDDPSLLHTALREAQEEIGIRPADLQVLGALPPVETIGQVRIFPWVASLSLPYPFKLSFEEVEKLLFLPLNDLLIQGLAPVKVRVGDRDVKSDGIYCDGELVWGATARILKEFREKALMADKAVPLANESA